MLEQQLPDSIEVAHDITIHTDSRTGLAKAVDGFDGGTSELFYGTTPETRNFGLAMGILGALGELSRKGAVTANADHVLSTAAGAIMVDTKHWTGKLSLDEDGQFTVGPNNSGSPYRQKVAKTPRFEASRLNGGDVAGASGARRAKSPSSPFRRRTCHASLRSCTTTAACASRSRWARFRPIRRARSGTRRASRESMA